MKYILNLAYLLLLLACLPLLLYQRVFRGKVRPALWKKFCGSGPVRKSNRRCTLFHAVSLGEVQAIRDLVDAYVQLHPHTEVMVSTTTQTGYNAARKAFPDLEVCFFPFDFSWSVTRFLNRIRPDRVVLAELEIWPNFLATCHEVGIRCCLVNARLNARSTARYQRIGFFFERIFGKLDLVCVQTPEYATRFQQAGVPHRQVVVTGNLKYDALLTDRSHPSIQEKRSLIQWQDQDLVFLAGSTQAPEETYAIDSFLQLRQQFENLRLFLCPRHPERFDEVARILQQREVPFSRRSELPPAHQVESNACEKVVLLDSVGELRYWWGVADIAFVGGSFGNRGGQNMMEPAALGAAVSFGPHTRNFRSEVQLLNEAKACEPLAQPEDLTRFLEKCLTDRDYRQRLGKNARKRLQQSPDEQGTAREKTLKALADESNRSHQAGERGQAA
ncbi:MAG: 3-deoxy-D-manno-octulosonic acid transferase [Planctomycetota bacterium]|nr:3-deoxy-D-manno-octulosonic acid transferase [Planctomycetota bacterium]